MKRKWLTSEEFWRGLEKLSFFILFPSVLFENISKVDFVSLEIFSLIFALGASAILVAICLIIYQKKVNYNKILFTSVFQGIIRYNNYMFFAIGASLLGKDGLAIVSTVSPYMMILTNILSIGVFSYYIPRNINNISYSNTIVFMIKTISSNPLIIASMIGFLFNYFSITLNSGIDQTIHKLSNSALTIGMITIGARLKFKISPEHLKLVLYTSTVKLIIYPLITFIILNMITISDKLKSVGILYSCLPCASTAYILSRFLKGDPDTMSSIITFSTIFSIISLSILVYILGKNTIL